MLTLKQIAQQLGISVARARLGTQKAGITWKDKTGRTHLYYDSDAELIASALSTTQTRERNAEPTASTSTVRGSEETQQRSQATVPPIEPVESDPQTLPESSPDM